MGIDEYGVRAAHAKVPVLVEHGPVTDLLTDLPRRLMEAVAEDWGDSSELPYDFKATDDAARIYSDAIAGLLHRVRIMSHGGTVLMVTSGVSYDALEDNGLLTVKYRCDDDALWRLLVRRLVWEGRLIEMLSDPQPRDATELLNTDDKLDSIYRATSDQLSLLAGLSADDQELRLLGAGCVILAEDSAELPLMEATTSDASSPRSVSPDGYGTRHRSAFRFCAAVPESIAFVVSQDGGVKAVTESAGRIIMWPDIADYSFATLRMNAHPGPPWTE
jgi:hypothetical protein